MIASVPVPLSLSAQASGSPSGPASAIISGILDAYGGPEALSLIGAYRVHGSLQVIGGDSSVSMIRAFTRPDDLRVEILYSEREEIRLLQGSEAWRSDAHGDLQRVDGPLHGSMVLQAIRSNIPWVLDEVREHAVQLPPLEFEGKSLPGIEFPVGGGLIMRAYTDPTAHQVLLTQGILHMGPLNTYFETRYSDFREVDGVLFPFREDTSVGGRHTGTVFVHRIELNPAIRNR